MAGVRIEGTVEGTDMIQCESCEYFSRDEASGRIMLRCDPFRTIKEPACLEKWQLLRLDALLQSYHATLRGQQKLAPMQEKMFKFLKREMDDIDESEGWRDKNEEDDGNADNEDENSQW